MIRIGKGEGLFTDALETDHVPVASRSPDGQLFFSMVGGLVTFDPAEVLRSVSGPPVRIVACRGAREEYHHADNSPVSREGNRLTPPPEAGGLLRIEFTALDVAYPEKDRFDYRLLPDSEDWIDGGDQHQAWF